MSRADNIKLVKKGNSIVLKQDIPSSDLSAKDVLNNIDALDGEIGKANQQLNKIKSDIPRLEESIEYNKKMLKKFNKFKHWAEDLQERKVRAIIAEIKDEVKDQVEKTYNHDNTLTDEENSKMKYRQYQHKLATHTKIAVGINSKVMKRMFFTDPAIDNPWQT